MFTYNRRYISENDTREDYINLDLGLDSSVSDWDRAISMLEDRLEGRYFEPVATLIQSDINKNGFAAMALCCLLVETLLQFREGYPRTPDRQNQQCYTDFLVNQFGDVFDGQKAKRFYQDIRCGILHSGQTKNGSCLTFDTDYVVRILGNNVMMVNIQAMFDELKHYFSEYCDNLRNPGNIKLRNNFIKKMDDLTKKWECSELIDYLWFAICEKEGRSFNGPYGRLFRFRVIQDGTTLWLSNNIQISKEEIEEALYYWPNERAIRTLDKGSFIFPILRLCRVIADDIIPNL